MDDVDLCGVNTMLRDTRANRNFCMDEEGATAVANITQSTSTQLSTRLQHQLNRCQRQWGRRVSMLPSVNMQGLMRKFHAVMSRGTPYVPPSYPRVPAPRDEAEQQEPLKKQKNCRLQRRTVTKLDQDCLARKALQGPAKERRKHDQAQGYLAGDHWSVLAKDWPGLDTFGDGGIYTPEVSVFAGMTNKYTKLTIITFFRNISLYCER
ncbi:hypothetical protein ARMGADRAFT_1068649 [Armillaria gallica]|uniref:Uncharacterized protein n=1 Tax=Armillaria gallica TaxID=47427 RepID=A0A2H3CDP2_ARMGA|nr:hypothetical protein ARMGADRAFT_1068649 [Armillaria gallica]